MDWHAEVEIGEEAALGLVRTALPEARRIEALAVGFDNTVFLVDGTWVCRFPRREIALPGVEVEARVLPRLAARLPFPIPCPEIVGGPGLGFPWPWLGYRLLPGVPLDVRVADPEVCGDLAAPLAVFLRTLHAPVLAAELAPHLPGDWLHRADMGRRVDGTLEKLGALRGHGVDITRLRELVEQARGIPPRPGRAVVHGDLHVRHVLLTCAARDLTRKGALRRSGAFPAVAPQPAAYGPLRDVTWPAFML